MNKPTAIAITSLFGGMGLAVGGVYVLFGLGWSLLVAAVPFIVLAALIFRGLAA